MEGTIVKSPGLRQFIVALTMLIIVCSGPVNAQQPIHVGSKVFNESYVLAEVISQLLENSGFEVERNFGMATMVVY